MSSGWETYGIVFLSAALSFVLYFGLRLLGLLAGARSPVAKAGSESTTVTSKKINTRFFVAANVAVLLLASVVLMFTFSVAGGTALLLMLPLCGFLLLSVFYASRKGDLSWIESLIQKGDS